MITHSIPLIIFLALVAAAVLANIITLLVIGGGSKWPHGAESVTKPSIAESIKLGDESPEGCDCPCHRTKMFPGMRCMDCFYEPCDEGTTE